MYFALGFNHLVWSSFLMLALLSDGTGSLRFLKIIIKIAPQIGSNDRCYLLNTYRPLHKEEILRASCRLTSVRSI